MQANIDFSVGENEVEPREDTGDGPGWWYKSFKVFWTWSNFAVKEDNETKSAVEAACSISILSFEMSSSRTLIGSLVLILLALIEVEPREEKLKVLMGCCCWW